MTWRCIWTTTHASFGLPQDLTLQLASEMEMPGESQCHTDPYLNAGTQAACVTAPSRNSSSCWQLWCLHNVHTYPKWQHHFQSRAYSTSENTYVLSLKIAIFPSNINDKPLIFTIRSTNCSKHSAGLTTLQLALMPTLPLQVKMLKIFIQCQKLGKTSLIINAINILSPMFAVWLEQRART